MVKAYSYEDDRRIFVDYPRKRLTFAKQKIENKYESQKSQQSPNQKKDLKQSPKRDASSPSLCPTESRRYRRRRRKPIREEVVRERGKTPVWLENLMKEEQGMDAKLIIEKTLVKTDVDIGQRRLLIPWEKIVEKDFFNKEELKIIDEHFQKIRNKGLDVILVDSRSKQWKLNLRRWDMTSNSYYALVSGWNDVVAHNELQEDDKLWIWSFRSLTKLYIVLVPRDLAPAPAPALASDLAQPSSLVLASVVT